MCTGFGCLAGEDMRIRFIEPNRIGDIHHTEIIKRLGWKDTESIFLRGFVRVECPDWTIDSFHFDEESTLPAWAENGRDEIKNQVVKVLEKAAPIYEVFRRCIMDAQTKYLTETDTARTEYYAKLSKYNDVSAADNRQCKKAIRVYDRLTGPAHKKLENAEESFTAKMIAEMSIISGYVPAKE